LYDAPCSQEIKTENAVEIAHIQFNALDESVVTAQFGYTIRRG
jgi:hypothetical protein